MPDAGENAAIQQKRVFTQPALKAYPQVSYELAGIGASTGMSEHSSYQ